MTSQSAAYIVDSLGIIDTLKMHYKGYLTHSKEYNTT